MPVPTLTLHTPESGLRSLFFLLQQGVALHIRTGASINCLLMSELELDPVFVDERVQTCFLNYSPVDDYDTAFLQDGDVLSLSAAMPGLCGATLRKDGKIAGFRSSIRHIPDQGSCVAGEPGTITFKLFNLLLDDVGAVFLARGVEVGATQLRAFFTDTAQPDFWTGTEAEFEGETLDPTAEAVLAALPADGSVRLRAFKA